MCGPCPDGTFDVVVVSSRPKVRTRVARAVAEGLAPHTVRCVDSVDGLLTEAAPAPGLVIADGSSPGVDPEALARLRSNTQRGPTAVIWLLDPARASTLSAQDAEFADDVVLTPCRAVELVARVRLGLGRLASRQKQREQAQALEELYSRQTEFLSVVSHEIRTPLSAIMSSAGILKRYGRDRPESVERFAGVIQQEGRRLTRLINNLLDLAKIEAGQVEWRLARTQVTELLELLKDSFAALIGERALRLEIEREGGPAEVVVDRDKIIQVLANLLSNAVKHSPEGGTVRLRCGGGPSGPLRLEVEDEGPGIPAGLEERIFGRFLQLEVGDERSGTGLGLTISRQIVEHHGGRVWAEPGRARGALLVIELPVGGGGEASHGAV